jgi:hypothetical protein
LWSNVPPELKKAKCGVQPPKAGNLFDPGTLYGKVKYALPLPSRILQMWGLFIKGTTHEIFKEQNINKSGSNGCT